MLHPDGRRLIDHWLTLAQRQMDCDPAESFEPFIYVWIAFNGWASCCIELDQDRQLVEAVSSSPELVAQFDKMLSTSPELVRAAEKFRSHWPIFKAQELKRLGALTYWQGNRQRTIAYYLGRGAKAFAPPCFQRHVEAGEEVPLDWPHVLSAIYQVRCNLFHGDKAPHSEIDRILSPLWVHTSRPLSQPFGC
jgi:hypothetical protein